MSIDNFTNSLIEMAEAVKAKPALEAEIETLKREVDISHSTIAIRGDKINSLETELAEAKARLEEARRDRVDAMFRTLELEEKLDTFASMAGKVLGMVKPQPKVEEPVAQLAPVEEVLTPTGYIPTVAIQDYGTPIATQYDTTTGQTEPVPTTPIASGDSYTTEPASPTNWEHGKPFHYKPWYMSESEWADKGGLPNPDTNPLAF